jgi:hypothetical protein
MNQQQAFEAAWAALAEALKDERVERGGMETDAFPDAHIRITRKSQLAIRAAIRRGIAVEPPFRDDNGDWWHSIPFGWYALKP